MVHSCYILATQIHNRYVPYIPRYKFGYPSYTIRHQYNSIISSHNNKICYHVGTSEDDARKSAPSDAGGHAWFLCIIFYCSTFKRHNVTLAVIIVLQQVPALGVWEQIESLGIPDKYAVNII